MIFLVPPKIPGCLVYTKELISWKSQQHNTDAKPPSPAATTAFLEPEFESRALLPQWTVDAA